MLILMLQSSRVNVRVADASEHAMLECVGPANAQSVQKKRVDNGVVDAAVKRRRLFD
jgi:hypothetical protein